MEIKSDIESYASLMNSKVRLLELLSGDALAYKDELRIDAEVALDETKEALTWMFKTDVVVDKL